MQRRYITVLAVLGSAVVFASPGWGGDPAAKSPGDILDKGYQAARRGYWQEAMAQYNLATEMAPRNAEVWSNLAVALEAVGRWDDAGEAYRRALEIDRGNSKIQRNVVLYNEFYASYIEKEDPEEKEPDPESPDDGHDVDDPSDGASIDESPEEGASDENQS